MTPKPPDRVTELRTTSAALPCRVAPLPRELVSSYIHRLADANMLNTEELRVTITGDRRQTAPPRMEVLARLSGFCENTLRHALPELQPSALSDWHTRKAGPGCTLCGAARGATRPFHIWRRGPEDVLCRRHNRWTTGSNVDMRQDREQPNLTHQPEILAAHHLHLRLIRKHGRTNTTHAFYTAADILDHWRKARSHDHAATAAIHRRISIFLGPQWETVASHSPVAAAAHYPQQVALTRLMGTPFWKNLLLTDHLQAGRPAYEQRRAAVTAIHEYRRANPEPLGHLPDHLTSALQATYLLPDGPNLRRFMAELHRTVDPTCRWNPYPEKYRRRDLLDGAIFDPFIEWVQDEIHKRLHPDQPM